MKTHLGSVRTCNIAYLMISAERVAFDKTTPIPFFQPGLLWQADHQREGGSPWASGGAWPRRPRRVLRGRWGVLFWGELGMKENTKETSTLYQLPGELQCDLVSVDRKWFVQQNGCARLGPKDGTTLPGNWHHLRAVSSRLSLSLSPSFLFALSLPLSLNCHIHDMRC